MVHLIVDFPFLPVQSHPAAHPVNVLMSIVVTDPAPVNRKIICQSHTNRLGSQQIFNACGRISELCRYSGTYIRQTHPTRTITHQPGTP
jgi:hypothetical protein